MYFITFRLADSLPFSMVQQLQAQRDRERQRICMQFQGQQQREELYKLDKKYFGWFDSWLDRCVQESPRWLADANVAQIVADEIHALDGKRYRLIAYCLMPNHVHLAIDTAGYEVEPAHHGPTAAYPLTDMLKRLKGRKARLCNLTLGRSASFWHHESYDHVIRNQQEYERIIKYILNNPVKAGLAEKWEDWRFSFLAM